MTIVAYTGRIDTNNQYDTIESLTDITFTVGNTYTMQVQNDAYIKIGDAEFYVADEKFQYKAINEDIYIKTTERSIVLTILESSAST